MRSVKLFVVVLGALLATGCNIFENEDRSEQARVQITGTSEVDIRVITSTRFAFYVDPSTGDRESLLEASDTVEIRPPFDEVYDISQYGIFLVRIINEEQTPADLDLQISIDGARKLSQEMTIGADANGNPGSFEWSWLN